MAGRSRKLSVRTYSVVCLNEDTGLIEWVPQTVGLRNVISETYVHNGREPVMKTCSAIKAEFDRMQYR